jgi:hypothetical protein
MEVICSPKRRLELELHSTRSQKASIINVIFVVRFEVFAAVTMKNGVFWEATPCASCKNRRFGGT